MRLFQGKKKNLQEVIAEIRAAIEGVKKGIAEDLCQPWRNISSLTAAEFDSILAQVYPDNQTKAQSIKAVIERKALDLQNIYHGGAMEAHRAGAFGIIMENEYWYIAEQRIAEALQALAEGRDSVDELAQQARVLWMR